MLKFDHSNVIGIEGASQTEESDKEVFDIDDLIAKNLSSSKGLVVMFTIAKLLKILKPYIEENQLSHFDKNLFNSFYSTLPLLEKP